MRIPAEMVMEMVEEMVEEEMLTVSELEMVKAELAAMEARAMAAEEAMGVTAADVTAIKMMIDDLIARQKKVEKGLKGVRDETVRMPDVVGKINASLMDHAKASKKKISKVSEQVDALSGDVAKLNEMSGMLHEREMEGLKASEEMLAAGIKADAESPEKLHKMKKDATEEPSNSKRTLVFLTTLAGTAAWFAISAIGSE